MLTATSLRATVSALASDLGKKKKGDADRKKEWRDLKRHLDETRAALATLSRKHGDYLERTDAEYVATVKTTAANRDTLKRLARKVGHLEAPEDHFVRRDGPDWYQVRTELAATRSDVADLKALVAHTAATRHHDEAIFCAEATQGAMPQVLEAARRGYAIASHLRDSAKRRPGGFASRLAGFDAVVALAEADALLGRGRATAIRTGVETEPFDALRRFAEQLRADMDEMRRKQGTFSQRFEHHEARLATLEGWRAKGDAATKDLTKRLGDLEFVCTKDRDRTRLLAAAMQQQQPRAVTEDGLKREVGALRAECAIQYRDIRAAIGTKQAAD